EDLHRQVHARDQTGLLEGSRVNGRSILKAAQIGHVNDMETPLELEVAEAALGKSAEDRRLAMFVAALYILADARLGALGTATGGLALVAAAPATLAGALGVAGGAAGDFVDHAHGSIPVASFRLTALTANTTF